MVGSATLTTSFDIPGMPRTSRVRLPQACGSVSQVRSQTSHRRSSCSVAPSSESTVAPAMPAIGMMASSRMPTPNTAGPRKLMPTSEPASTYASRRPIGATSPIQSAPPISAAVPAGVIPPDMPVENGRKVTMDRGVCRASVPISVAHVSAVAAAYAPANASAQRRSCANAKPTAHAVATPPFASTCNASRAPCLPTSTSARLRARPTRDNATDEPKNASKISVKPAVPAPYVSVPTTNAAIAPDRVSVPARHATNATMPARAAPITTSSGLTGGADPKGLRRVRIARPAQRASGSRSEWPAPLAELAFERGGRRDDGGRARRTGLQRVQQRARQQTAAAPAVAFAGRVRHARQAGGQAPGERRRRIADERARPPRAGSQQRVRRRGAAAVDIRHHAVAAVVVVRVAEALERERDGHAVERRRHGGDHRRGAGGLQVHVVAGSRPRRRAGLKRVAVRQVVGLIGPGVVLGQPQLDRVTAVEDARRRHAPAPAVLGDDGAAGCVFPPAPPAVAAARAGAGVRRRQPRDEGLDVGRLPRRLALVDSLDEALLVKQAGQRRGSRERVALDRARAQRDRIGPDPQLAQQSRDQGQRLTPGDHGCRNGRPRPGPDRRAGPRPPPAAPPARAAAARCRWGPAPTRPGESRSPPAPRA